MTAFWIGLLILVIIISIAGLIYLTMRVSTFLLIRKLSKEKPWPARVIAFFATIAGIAVCYLLTGYTNTAVILVCFVITSLIGQLIALIYIKSSLKRNPDSKARSYRNKIVTAVVLILSGIYLGTGYYFAHHVSVTSYSVKTDKAVEPVTIALITDLHVGTTFNGSQFKKHAEKISSLNPDIILIGGDFVDGSSKLADTKEICDALGSINTRYGTYFSYGNHDKNVYGEDQKRDFTSADLASMLKNNGVTILEDEIVTLENGYTIIGRRDKSEKIRATAAELMSLADADNYVIAIDHQPNDCEAEADAGIDLVVSGHTHGGQLYPINNIGKLLGLNDIIYGTETRKNTTFIVSSGIGDWTLDFKSGTISEIVLINIIPE